MKGFFPRDLELHVKYIMINEINLLIELSPSNLSKPNYLIKCNTIYISSNFLPVTKVVSFFFIREELAAPSSNSD